MNQFTERYKLASNTELLKIIENSDDYQALAVETAKSELDSRKLTETDLNSARAELNIIRHESQQKEQKKQEKIDKVNNIAKSAFDILNPIQETPLKTNKIIKVISLVFGGIAIYQIIKEFGMLKFMFSGQGEWDLSMVFYFLPLILILTASILFWTRKKIGWILIEVYLTYSAVAALLLTIQTWDIKPIGDSQFDSIFPSTSPYLFLLTFVFYVGMIWIIGKRNIKEEFNINKMTMFTTIIGTSLFTFIFLGQLT